MVHNWYILLSIESMIEILTRLEQIFEKFRVSDYQKQPSPEPEISCFDPGR